MNVAPPVSASTFVIAAVSVVFPWSTCPIVPTLQCGFVRSNFAFAISSGSYRLIPPTIVSPSSPRFAAAAVRTVLGAGAGDGNRTHVASLEGWSSTIELHPQACIRGACPSNLLRSEEHTSELQSRPHLVCRLLLEKKKKKNKQLIEDKKKKKK